MGVFCLKGAEPQKHIVHLLRGRTRNQINGTKALCIQILKVNIEVEENFTYSVL